MQASPRRTDRSFVVPVVAVLLAALLGILVGRASVSAADRPERASTASSVAPTREGAARAAIGYLDALRWDVLVDDARRRRAIAARATPDAVAQLDAELAAPAEALRGAVTRPPIVARTAVLGYRVKLLHRGRAAVRVWGMALFGTGAYAPATQWSTSDLSLVWSGQRWLVDGAQSRGGPSPESSLATLARSDRTLREVRNVP
jgi:hypothetical protein